MRIEVLASLLLLSVSASSVEAQQVDGKQVERRVSSLTKAIDWKRSISSLKSAGQEEGKMLLWIQVVGKLDDGL